MEEAEEEHREVTATVTASQTTLQLSPDRLAMPSMSYSSPSNVRFCANVQTGPFSGGSVHLFQSTMSGNIYTLYRTASENTGFPRVEPPHGVISLFAPNWAPSSTPRGEVEPLKEQSTVVSCLFPTIVAASPTTRHSRSSLSPSSPSTAGSTPTSPSTHSAIGGHKRNVEYLSVSVGPLPTAAGIQREGPPLRYVRVS